MSKRKNDDATHQSRIDFDQSGDVEDSRGGAGAGGGGSFLRADPSTLASRRTVQASGLLSDGSGHGSKRFRRDNYQREMTELNDSFRRYGEHLVSIIKAEIEERRRTGAVKEGPPTLFTAAAMEYIYKAAQIRAKYKPVVGDILTSGTGEMGQLGWPEERLNSAMTFNRFQLVKNLRGLGDGDGIIAIDSGGQFNLLLTADGKVYSWGCNDEGALGQCDYTQEQPPQIDTSWSPEQVKGFLPSPAPPGMSFIDRPDEAIIAVAAGDCHALALSDKGNVYFFGSYRDKEGRKFRDLPPSDDPRTRVEVKLRTAEEIEENKGPEQPPKGMQRWPIHVVRIKSKVKSIACNASSNVALTEDDTLLTWGVGESGEMARETPPARNPDGSYNVVAIRDQLVNPTAVVFGGPQNVHREIVDVACGLYHTIVIVREFDGNSSNGLLRVYTCGANNYGQLGRGKVGEFYNTLEPVEDFDRLDIVKAAGGENHSMFLDITGRGLYVCGRDDAGQLGITPVGETPATYALEERPVPLTLEEGKQNPVISRIECGSWSSMVVTASGEAYTWGFGENGALGHGRPPKPQKVVKPKKGEQEDISHLAKNEYRPRKLDVMAGVRKQEAKQGKSSSGAAKVQMISAGAQHSVVIVTREQGF